MILILFVILSSTPSPDAQTASSITITVPNANTIWHGGDNVVMTWDVEGPPGNLRIHLLKGEVEIMKIHNDIFSDGDFTWDVETNLTSGMDYQIKMHDKTYGGDYYSSEFEIVGNIIEQSSTSSSEVLSGSTTDTGEPISADITENGSSNNPLPSFTLSNILLISILISFTRKKIEYRALNSFC